MATQSSLVDLPLFPLASVLFPRGQVSLSVFEPRYLDLVRECARNDSGFGACLITQGSETDPSSLPAAVGTVARIADFHRGADGLLKILAEGAERFTVKSSRARHDGLLRGDVAMWDTEPQCEVPAEFSLLQSVAERLVESMSPR